MMQYLYSPLAFLVLILILVSVHEFGHFWVARLCGVKVHCFSVGFGPRLLQWRDRFGTDFILAAIPLGGYVKMLDEREEEVPPELHDQCFTRKTVWQRMAIVFAGPAANLILAVLVYWVLAMAGSTGVSPVIGEVIPDSLAAKAGVEAQQEILSVDGHATPTRELVARRLIDRIGDTGELVLGVQYPDSNLSYSIAIPLHLWLSDAAEPDPVRGLGIDFYMLSVPPVIGNVEEGSPAGQAGVQPGDTVVSVDGQPFAEWVALVKYIRARPDQTLSLILARDGQQVPVSVVTRRDEDPQEGAIGRIGIGPQIPEWPAAMLREYRSGPIEALGLAVTRTGSDVSLTVRSLIKMVQGRISPKNLSGPISIAKVAGDSAKAGWKIFATILVSLSIGLAVINLLPIPVLDGGHLLFYLIEAVKGSPVPEKIQWLGYQVGMFMVLSMMTLAVYNDVMRF